MYPNFPFRIGSFPALRIACFLLALSGYFLPSLAHAEVTAVASRTFNGYVRTQLPDRSFQPETYAFAEGGRWDAPVAGDSIGDITFKKIIHTLAQPLADRDYVSAKDPEKTDLMIFVSWGTTQGTDSLSSPDSSRHVGNALNRLPAPTGVHTPPVPSHSGTSGSNSLDGLPTNLGSEQAVQASVAKDELETSILGLVAENRWRDQSNEKNAIVLGFQDNLKRAYMTEFTSTARDLIHELEESRYFVVLKAYDFRLAWKEKKQKVLWETRFSIRRRGNDFGEQLAGMSKQASHYFGLHTNGLVRETLPEVNVTLGEIRVVKE